MPFVHGIRHEGNFRAELLLSSDPDTVIQDFLNRKADIALVPVSGVPLLADARVITSYCVGGVSSGRSALLSCSDPLVTEEWRSHGTLPFAFALWVAHAEVDGDTEEALERALTYGLEHGYESLLESPSVSDVSAAYGCLSCFDHIFDNDKNRAVHKYWDAGVKVSPRANPG